MQAVIPRSIETDVVLSYTGAAGYVVKHLVLRNGAVISG